MPFTVEGEILVNHVGKTRAPFPLIVGIVFRGVYYLAKLCYETIHLQICDESLNHGFNDFHVYPEKYENPRT